MSSQIKTYFLAPNWDFQPGGLIRLGSLITDPRKPERCLNNSKQVEINPKNLYHSSKKDWNLSRAQLGEFRVGIWASFLQLSGFGGHLTYTKTRGSNEVFRCESLDTDYFQPDDAYILEGLQNPVVQSYFGHTWHREPIYMITGIKTARGFTVTYSGTNTHAGDGNVGVDGTGIGIPIQVGPEFKLSSTRTEDTLFHGSSDCVFAYQLIKIRSKKNSQFSEEDYTRGALLHKDTPAAPQVAKELREDWEVISLEASVKHTTGLVENSVYDEDSGDCCTIMNISSDFDRVDSD